MDHVVTKWYSFEAIGRDLLPVARIPAGSFVLRRARLASRAGRARRGAGRHVRALLFRASGTGARDRLGECLRLRRRKAAHPGGLDLADAFAFGLTALSFVLGMPGHDPSLLCGPSTWAPECTRHKAFRAAAGRFGVACGRRPDDPVAYPSPVSLYTVDDPRDLIAPVLVAAFDGWVDAGSAATTALGIVADDASVVATFDPDALFDYRARRPPLEIVDGRLTELAWPELVLRRTRIEERDLLVLVGPEPDYRWRAFVSGMAELARRFAVAEWISLGAIPAAVPHTRPVPILGTEAQPGLLRGEVAAGPAGVLRVPSALVSALEFEVSTTGIPALGYFAQVPHYVSGPYATAALALLRSLGGHLDVDIPAGELEEEARELRTRLDAAAAADDTTRGYVERLEAMYDEQRLPAGDDLISDIERFLRDQGGRGSTRG
jgi:hypothetical protein